MMTHKQGIGETVCLLAIITIIIAWLFIELSTNSFRKESTGVNGRLSEP